MEAEIARLKAELDNERELRQSLECECDVLALANVKLENELSILRDSLRSANSSNGKSNFSSALVSPPLPPVDATEQLVCQFDGDGLFANKPKLKIEDACGGMNVLSVAFCYYSVDATNGSEKESIACGGTDNSVSVYDTTTGSLESKFLVGAPILMLDAHPTMHYLAASMMDGTAAVINLKTSAIVRLRDHTKYVVSIRWSPDGRFLATASHDKSVVLYAVNYDTDDSELVVEKKTAVRLSHTPESCLFVPLIDVAPAAEVEQEAASDATSFELLIAARDTKDLILVRCEGPCAFEQRLVSLNENEWDTHVSLTPLFTALSPDSRCVIIATDKNMHFMTQVGQSKRLRVFAAHSCGDYGKPRIALDCEGMYMYSNSENDSSVYIYDVNSQLVVGKLSGHKNVVKDICCSRRGRTVATASFDHSVILWHSSHNS